MKQNSMEEFLVQYDEIPMAGGAYVASKSDRTGYNRKNWALV